MKDLMILKIKYGNIPSELLNILLEVEPTVIHSVTPLYISFDLGNKSFAVDYQDGLYTVLIVYSKMLSGFKSTTSYVELIMYITNQQACV